MNRQELVDTLELLKPALSDTPLVGVFQCFQFTGEKVIAYNDEIGIVAPCQTDHPFAVNGEILLGLLKNSLAEDVTLSPGVKSDENELAITAGRSSFKLPYFAEADFLFEEPEDKWDTTITITDAIKQGLTACLATVSSDTARPALMGVCIHNADEIVILYSCDGNAITSIVTEVKSQKLPDITVPTSFVRALLNVMETTEAETGKLMINQEWAKAVTKNALGASYTVYGRLIVQDNPVDHTELIIETIKGDPAFHKIPGEFELALSRARVLADLESAKTVLTVMGNRLKLLTETHMGIVRDSLAYKCPEDVEASVSAELLHRIIAECDEMAVMDNCTVFRNQANGLFRLVSNLGE